MNERIVFIGRNKNYQITQLCYQELVKYTQDTKHQAVLTVVSDDNHGSEGTLEALAENAGLSWTSVTNNDVNDPKFIQKLKKLNPTILITVQFPKIFKSDLIETPERACLNIHRGWPYRGGSIDERAIYFKLKTYNVILHHMSTGIDTGNIIGKEAIQLNDTDDGFSLVKKADEAGRKLFIESFLPILGNPIPVSETQVIGETVYGSKGSLSNVIAFTDSAANIERLCRAFHHPRKMGAAIKVKSQYIFVIPPVEIISDSTDVKPGTILSLAENKVVLATGDLMIAINKCHTGDKKPISFSEVLKGIKMGVGDCLV